MKNRYLVQFCFLINFIFPSGFLFSPNVLNIPSHYSIIQETLNTASAGDTILVQPETYNENLFWPNLNGIKLIATCDTSNTIIDGGSQSSVIMMISFGAVIDSTTIIRGLKIQNGGNVQVEGGLQIQDADPILISLKMTNNFKTN